MKILHIIIIGIILFILYKSYQNYKLKELEKEKELLIQQGILAGQQAQAQQDILGACSNDWVCATSNLLGGISQGLTAALPFMI